MIKPKSNHIARWLLTSFMALHLIGGHGGLEEFVLCLGFDGHVAIETATAQDICNDLETPHSETEPPAFSDYVQISAEDHCGTCVDMPIGSDCHEFAKIQPKESFIQLSLTASLIDHLNRFPAIEPEPNTASINSNISTNTSLISLQTIVLLI